jgi:pimeloyl-ACP methyl ester carboxylesterase
MSRSSILGHSTAKEGGRHESLRTPHGGTVPSVPRPAAWALGTAVVLAIAAIETRRRGRAAERDAPPQGHFVTAAGTKLHYTDTGGDGPALVLLHGNGSMLADMKTSGVVDIAADRYRVISFDRPGYGYSERPRGRIWTPRAQARVLRVALAEIGVSEPIVLGHSWGTLVALALALDHPGFARGLVLVSGYYFPTPRLETALFGPNATPVIGDLLRHTVSPLISRALLPRAMRGLFDPQPVPARFKAGFSLDLVARPLPLRASAEEAIITVPSAKALAKR